MKEERKKEREETGREIKILGRVILVQGQVRDQRVDRIVLVRIAVIRGIEREGRDRGEVVEVRIQAPHILMKAILRIAEILNYLKVRKMFQCFLGFSNVIY